MYRYLAVYICKQLSHFSSQGTGQRRRRLSIAGPGPGPPLLELFGRLRRGFPNSGAQATQHKKRGHNDNNARVHVFMCVCICMCIYVDIDIRPSCKHSRRRTASLCWESFITSVHEGSGCFRVQFEVPCRFGPVRLGFDAWLTVQLFRLPAPRRGKSQA